MLLFRQAWTRWGTQASWSSRHSAPCWKFSSKRWVWVSFVSEYIGCIGKLFQWAQLKAGDSHARGGRVITKCTLGALASCFHALSSMLKILSQARGGWGSVLSIGVYTRYTCKLGVSASSFTCSAPCWRFSSKRWVRVSFVSIYIGCINKLFHMCSAPSWRFSSKRWVMVSFVSVYIGCIGK